MFFYLYMIINVFSRKIIGWEVHHQESRFNAGILVHKAILSEGCTVSPPVLHPDNGAPQKSFTLLAKLEALWEWPPFPQLGTSYGSLAQSTG